MNTTLPPSRDLPLGRHAEIRAAVARAVERRRRRWVLPLVTAGAALGLVLWLVPWDRPDSDTITVGGQPPASPTASPAPGVVGLTADQAQEIADGCAAGAEGKFTLYQYLVDDAGKVALVYSDDRALVCQIDGPVLKYNASYGDFSGMTPPLVIDHVESASGGDNGKPEYAGMRGYDVVAGRISPEVATVTVTIGSETMDAAIANGTFLARFVRPSDWVIPEAQRYPSVVAYDENGVKVGAVP